MISYHYQEFVLGGSLFSQGFRMPREQWISWSTQRMQEIQQQPWSRFYRTAWTRPVASKASFGDADLLCENMDSDLIFHIQTLWNLGPDFRTTSNKQGDIDQIHFPWHSPCQNSPFTFQVDLIRIPTALPDHQFLVQGQMNESFLKSTSHFSPDAYWSWAQCYYSYNDLPNLLNAWLHPLGFFLKDDGLWSRWTDPQSQCTLDWRWNVSWYQMLDALELSSSTYQQWQSHELDCFDTLFQWMLDSPLFESLGGASRFGLGCLTPAQLKKQTSRTTYKLFLDFLHQHNLDPNHPLPDMAHLTQNDFFFSRSTSPFVNLRQKFLTFIDPQKHQRQHLLSSFQSWKNEWIIQKQDQHDQLQAWKNLVQQKLDAHPYFQSSPISIDHPHVLGKMIQQWKKSGHAWQPIPAQLTPLQWDQFFQTLDFSAFQSPSSLIKPTFK